MDPTRSAGSSKKRLGRIPSAKGAVRLSEADLEKRIPAEMRPYWPTMAEKEKKEVKKILANTLYLKKECNRFVGQKSSYEKRIESYEKAMTSLKEDKEDIQGKVALNMKIQEELKEKLAENEKDLRLYKGEVKRQLKNKEEADSLKSEISDIKKAIKEKQSRHLFYKPSFIYSGHICMFWDITLHPAWNIQQEAPKTAEMGPLISWTFVLVFPYCNVLHLPETFLELISTADIVTNLMQNKTKKIYKKINIKAAQEKEVFSQFSKKLETLKEARDLIEKKGLLPENKLDALNESITDFQFDLALYEDDDKVIEQYNNEIESNIPIKK